MSRMVQIRNVPEALHRKLKARAADAGRTLETPAAEVVREERDSA